MKELCIIIMHTGITATAETCCKFYRFQPNKHSSRNWVLLHKICIFSIYMHIAIILTLNIVKNEAWPSCVGSR